MDCKSCGDDLTAYLDGELDSSRIREVEEHLKACPTCLEEFRGLERASRLVESCLDELEPKPELWDNLLTRIEAKPVNAKPAGLLQLLLSRRWTAVAATVAASIVLAAGLLGIWSHQQSERALRQYMNEYVQKRNNQERTFRVRPVRVSADATGNALAHSEVTDNPFADVDTQEIDNPFRSEEQ